MFHLKPISKGFIPIKLRRNQFLLACDQSSIIETALLCFFDAPENCRTLDPLEETRGVYLLEGEQQWVLKYNHLTSWKKQLTNFFGRKKSYGLHDLTNEFINLQKINPAADFIPRVAAYGYRTRRLFFLKEEYLLVNFYANHCDIDRRLQGSPDEAESLLEQVFTLFSKMLGLGFCHLDPHPKNILIGPDNQLRLIDFECCAHQVLEQNFALGFLHGYFYTYWYQRFISKERYHQISDGFLRKAHPSLDRAVFEPVYLKFRDHKVGRTTRYSVMTSLSAQQKFYEKLKAG